MKSLWIVLVYLFFTSIILTGCVRNVNNQKSFDWSNVNTPVNEVSPQELTPEQQRYEQVLKSDIPIESSQTFSDEDLQISFNYPKDFKVEKSIRPGQSQKYEVAFVSLAPEFSNEYKDQNPELFPQLALEIYEFENFDDLINVKSQLINNQKSVLRDLNGNIYEEYNDDGMTVGKGYIYNSGNRLYHFTFKSYPTYLLNPTLRDSVDFGFMQVLKTFQPAYTGHPTSVKGE